MDLAIITKHLEAVTRRTMFDAWVSTNLIDLSNYFYSLSKTDLQALEFDNFYFGVFTQSAVFKEFEATQTQSDPFISFINLLAATCERLAQSGITAPIDHIHPYLQDSSIKFRLQCLSKIQNIDNSKKDYIEFFPTILEWLAKAEDFEEENYTQRIVDFLIYYYHKAEDQLLQRGYKAELHKLKTLFLDNAHIKKYHFLGHSTIQEVIQGKFAEALEVERPPKVILYPSMTITQLFTHGINKVVLGHEETRGFEILMGYSKSTIRNQILDYGKTDFDVPYKDLSPGEKVLLYCYFNMKKHFFTSRAVYEKTWPQLRKMLSNSSHPAVFIDIGCGPLTSGLALGDLYQTKEGIPLMFHYIGIDISRAMLEKASEFSEIDLFDGEATFSFHSSWNDLTMTNLALIASENSHIFINTSYLFASSSLNIKSLAKFVSKLKAHFKYLHFIFQNPDRADRNTKWIEFKELIAYREVVKDVEKIIYKTSLSSFAEPGSEDVSFEILEIRS